MSKNTKQDEMSKEEFQEKVMERVEEKQSENFNFIMVGGNVPELNETIMKAANEQDSQIVVFELDNEEMKFITHSRSTKKAEEEAVDFLNKPEAIKQAKENCIQICKINFGDDFEIDGLVNSPWISKKFFKKKTNASWKQLDEVLNNLDLFGMLEWGEDKKDFRVSIDQEIILRNKVNELEQILNLAKGKILALDKNDRKNMNPESKKVLTSLKRKFNTEREWNLPS